MNKDSVAWSDAPSKAFWHCPLALTIGLLVAASLAFGRPALGDNLPSMDSDAFHRFNLYLDRTSAAGTTDHVSIGAYPASVNSTQLVVVRGAGDTACVINSAPYDAINMEVDSTRKPSATTRLRPPGMRRPWL